jgi:hypothetical protein
MTDEKLQEYVDKTQTYFDQAGEIANKQAQETTLTAETIIANFQTNNEKLNEYNSLISSLGSRLDDSEFKDYVLALGLDSVDALRAISNATDSQIEEMSAQYNTSWALATQAAKTQSADTAEQLSQELTDLYGYAINIDEWIKQIDGTYESLFTELKGSAESAAKAAVKSAKSTAVSQTKSAVKKVAATTASEVKTNSSTVSSTVASEVKTGTTKVLSATKSTTTSAGKTMAKNVTTGISSQDSAFYNSGVTNAQNYIDGLNSKTSELNSALAKYQAAAAATAAAAAAATASAVAASTSSAASKSSSSLSSSGSSMGAHIIGGITSSITSSSSTAKLTSATSSASSTLVSSTKAALRIASPSKVFAEIGNYVTLGLINGIMQNISRVAEASEELTNMVTSGATSLSQVFTDEDLVIRPSVDLSNVESSMDKIATMFNTALDKAGIDISGTASVITQAKATAKAEEEKQKTQKPGDTNITFNQTNNSPKALDRYTIYRQTRNQLKQIKEVARA